MKTLRCIIVDDEPLAVKMLEGYVARTPSLALAGSFNDPVQALSEIRTVAPEIVFLDIQMPDLDGLELSRMLPPDTRVIFTTAFKQYAFDSYEVSALDFLLKPIRYQKFLEAVQKAREWFDLKDAAAQPSPVQEKTSVYIKVDGTLLKVELADIRYVEGMKDYVMFHLASRRQPLVTHLTMKAVEELLPPARFLRIHRSHVVNLERIDSVSPQGDVKVGDTLLHVSEGYRPAFDAYLQSQT
ncbi:MAG: response regulator transcription factor [Bacteroidales bacterium]|nr:response regulator transcription factor [Bacteroidales bacterium]